MVDLTTTTAVKAQLHITGTLDDTLISDYVTQASEMFSVQTRQQFYATGGATLTYDINQPDIYGRKLFFGRMMLGVDRVYNGDGNVIPTTDYRLLPPNDSPKYALEIYPNASTFFIPVNDNQGYEGAVQVNGTIGFCLTGQQPADVTLAVTRLAAWLYATRDSNGAVVQFADGTMAIPTNAPAFVLQIAGKYARLQIFSGYR